MAVEKTNEKKVSTIEIKCDSFTKNDSTENSIECGSGSTFSATVKYSDGTTATGDDAKVQWKITGSDSNNNVYTKVNDDGNKYNVGDTITVKTTGSPSICNLYGVWKSDTTDETTESADNNTSTADESSGSDMTSPKTGNNDGLLIVMFSLCLVAICGVCVYKIKK